MMKNRRFIKILITVFLTGMEIFFPTLIYAKGESVSSSENTFSVLVLPVIDGELDEETKELNQSLQFCLNQFENLRLFSEEEIQKIFEYYAPLQDVPLSTFEDVLIHAKRRYQEADIFGASRIVEKLIQTIEKKNDLRTDGSVLEEAYFLQILCAWAKREKRVIQTNFEKLFSLNPQFKLDANLFATGLVSLFNEYKQTHKRPSGTITFDIQPAGARVIINGIEQCLSPCSSVELPSGEYFLDVKLSRYESLVDTVHIISGSNISYHKLLQWSDKPQESRQKLQITADNLLEKIKTAIHIGRVSKIDKVIIVNALSSDKSKVTATFQLADVEHAAGQPPFSFQFQKKKEIPEKHLDGVTRAILAGIAQDIVENPGRYVDPKGFGDLTVLGRRHKKITKQPAFWAVVGGIVLGGILTGVLLSGGSEQPSSPVQETKIKLRIE